MAGVELWLQGPEEDALRVPSVTCARCGVGVVVGEGMRLQEHMSCEWRRAIACKMYVGERGYECRVTR